MAGVVARIGTSYLTASDGERWSENPGDALIFIDNAAANAYASARGVTVGYVLDVVTTDDNPTARVD